MTRHIIPISGKDSLACALIQTTRHPEHNYEFFFNDIGTELPETYEWLSLVERKTGWKIMRIGKSLYDRILQYNYLPSAKSRFCTSDTKISPMERFFKGSDITVYYGLRVDENRVGKRPSDTMKHVYPLRDANINLRGVYKILQYQDLLPPAFFWHRLYYRVCEMIGSDWQILDELEEWETRMLFAGRSRSNCYLCFFQRLYEYVWLAETHPTLFELTCRMERTIGKKDFTWKQGYFLDEKIRRDKDSIFEKRAVHIYKLVRERFNKGLFASEMELENELAMTSCGLLCGK